MANNDAVHAHQVRRRQTASLMRWLHIYLSMVSFAILFFFAITGLTLNHPDWFANRARTTQLKGTLAPNPAKPGPVETVDQPALVASLRRAHGLQGTPGEIRVDETQCSVAFKGPGYSADAFVDRETGEYELTETRLGLVAVLNDLHKGRDSGRLWSWIIDLSAGLMTVVSLTGLVLLWFVKRRRVSGFLLAVAGGLLALAIYFLWVP
ncbi:MAG: PepSY-associated TM helix domain-containing protein [Blastocatellia bacterium]|nr:PepSY-associated TM helix domain-containing protein [Blastocatellia bacterium]